jgi:hypothetical protein
MPGQDRGLPPLGLGLDLYPFFLSISVRNLERVAFRASLAHFHIEIGRMEACAGNIFMVDKNKMEYVREVRAVC